LFTGIDWAAEVHAVCVIDPAGEAADRFAVAHSAEGRGQLVGRLAGLGDPGGMPVAIERPDGRLVDALLEAGHPVVPVKPNAIRAWRDGEVLSGAKSDAADAAVIAGYLRVRHRKLRVATPYSGQTRALRAVVRTRDDLAGLRVAAVNVPDRGAAARLGEHPDGKIFTSLPRPGQISAAQMLAEWGDCRPACDGPDSVAALAGCTPVTRESGKHRAVHFRWSCNKRFRRAITIYADNSRHASPWAASICNQARGAGKDHPHAVRILARAWIRVIWRCWTDGVPYDPARHGAAAALTQQTGSQSAA
jgi:transposase